MEWSIGINSARAFWSDAVLSASHKWEIFLFRWNAMDATQPHGEGKSRRLSAILGSWGGGRGAGYGEGGEMGEGVGAAYPRRMATGGAGHGRPGDLRRGQRNRQSCPPPEAHSHQQADATTHALPPAHPLPTITPSPHWHRHDNVLSPTPPTPHGPGHTPDRIIIPNGWKLLTVSHSASAFGNNDFYSHYSSDKGL